MGAMVKQVFGELSEQLRRYGQQHVLRWWNDLDAAQRDSLIEQIRRIDFEAVRSMLDGRNNPGGDVGDESEIRPAARVVRLPKEPVEEQAWSAAVERGNQALASGKVGVILVAGGQGTRLGFQHPKGMLPIGPVSGATLFQILAEQLLARSRRAGSPLPCYVMTSDATHDETIAFFRQHGCFGLNAGDVRFFKQGTMPAVDRRTGNILLAEKGAIAMSPDGHGGMLDALHLSGCLDDMRRRGVELLYYHQVDNPTAIVCDPAFLGFHILRDSEMSTKVVAKRDASEKMGVVVDRGGKTQIVEYIDLPPSLARAVDEGGNLLHWAGNTAIHVFSRKFLDRLVAENMRLPLPCSAKKVPFLDDAGNVVVPETENAIKFERFIFDVLPCARSALVVEADRAREFNPVKNAEGNDSPETARAAMHAVYRGWLYSAGIDLPDGRPIEISPLFALDAEDVKKRLSPDRRFDGPVFLN